MDRMLANAVRAPSAGFTQGWEFLVLDTPADVALFWDTTSPQASSEVEEARSLGNRAEVEEARTLGDRAEVEEARSVVTKPNRWLDGMRTAPVVIVPMSDKSAYLDRYQEEDKHTPDWPVPYWHMDTAMAALLILQTALDEGLGACFFGVPGARTDAFRAAFAIPTNLKPIGAITIGHRVEDTGSVGSPARRERRADVVHRGHYRT